MNAQSAESYTGIIYTCFSELFRVRQSSPTNRTQSVVWLYHYGELALGAFDGMDFDSFDFVGI